MRNRDERENDVSGQGTRMPASRSHRGRYRLRNPVRFIRRVGMLLLLLAAAWLVSRAFAPDRSGASAQTPSISPASPTPTGTAAPTATPEPTPDPAPAGTEWTNLLVVIDAGHGGRDPGTVSPDETIYEKHIALDVAKRCAAALENAGVPVLMTREEDQELASTVKADLRARSKLANDAGATLFVSIHVNSLELSQHGATGVFGLEAYYQNKENLFAGLSDKMLAEAVGNRVATSTGQPLNAVIRRGLAVLSGTRMPGMLLEIGYLSNAEDRVRLQDDTYCGQVADGVARAVLETIGTLRLETRNGVSQVLRNLPGQPENTVGEEPGRLPGEAATETDAAEPVETSVSESKASAEASE